METLRRCETEPEVSGSAGGGGESAECDEGTPHTRGPERGDNAENGSGNGNHDEGSVGALPGALADESETAGSAVD